MSRLILSLFDFMSNAILFLFSLRRWLFLLTVWRLSDQEGEHWPKAIHPLPSLLLLVPFRNEAANLRHLLPLLEQLDYPVACLTTVLIDDGSQDNSRRICQQFLVQHPNWHLLTLPYNQGKAAALNEALRHFPQGEFVAVFDADERPSPQTLTHLLAAFNTPENSSKLRPQGSYLRLDWGQVAAVNGRRAIINPLTTPVASYATIENLVHQLITNRAKDYLNLAPALLGSNCLYRRTALTAVGNFTSHVFLEDSDLTLRLTQAGWRTRYITTALSHHAAPTTVRAYWQQHTRWQTGFQQVAQAQTTAVLIQPRLSLLLRLELLLFSFGYLDRVALLIALARCWQRPSRLTFLNIILNLFTPFLQITSALKRAKAPRHLWWRLIYLPLFYALDMAATLTSSLQKLLRQTRPWEERQLLETSEVILPSISPSFHLP